MNDAGAIRRLRVTGAIAILTIALLTLVSAAFLAWRYETEPIRSDTVNRSGLRRGQSVAVLYRAERLARLPGAVDELDKAIQTLERSQDGLNDLDAADEAFYRRFIAAARSGRRAPERRQSGATRSKRSAGDVRNLLQNHHRLFGFVQRPTGALVPDVDVRQRRDVAHPSVALRLRDSPGRTRGADKVRALEERRRRFAAMFDNSSEMMAIYDAQGNIIRGNRSATKLLGFGADAVGAHFSLHVAPATAKSSKTRSRRRRPAGLPRWA